MKLYVQGTRRKYGDFNLDELSEGDRIGLMRKAGGDLHFFINGSDQGVAATRVPPDMWGVADLYGMVVKVTLVDSDRGGGRYTRHRGREEHNNQARKTYRAQAAAAAASVNSRVSRVVFPPYTLHTFEWQIGSRAKTYQVN